MAIGRRDHIGRTPYRCVLFGTARPRCRMSHAAVHRDGVVAVRRERRPVPGSEALGEDRGRRRGSARRSPRACSRARAGSRRRGSTRRRRAPRIPRRAAASVPFGVNSGTLPAITTTSNARPRASVGEVARAPTRPRRTSPAPSRASTRRRRRRRPRCPRRASSIATRPVPHPASSTRRGLVRGDERRLAVDVDARCGELVEPTLVVVAVPGHDRALSSRP